MRVELAYQRACPNVPAAREQLLRAFAALGVAPRWTEWDIDDAGAPAHVRDLGSPTILVGGRDVSDDSVSASGARCRVYAHADDRYRGFPQAADIVRAIRRARKGALPAMGGRSRWHLNSAALPAIGIALLPKLTCPACWPAYAGLLGALGIGFVDYTPYLLPLTVAFLSIALGGLAWRARTRRGYGPLLVGLGASGLLVAGKFGFDSDVAMYGGLALLVSASVWNTWPKPPGGFKPCGGCGSANETT